MTVNLTPRAEELLKKALSNGYSGSSPEAVIETALDRWVNPPTQRWGPGSKTREEAIADILDLQKENAHLNVTPEEIKSWIEEGRKY